MKSWIVYTTDSENKAKTSNVINPLCKPNPFLFFAVPWHFLNLMTLTMKETTLLALVRHPCFSCTLFRGRKGQRPEKRTKKRHIARSARVRSQIRFSASLQLFESKFIRGDPFLLWNSRKKRLGFGDLKPFYIITDCKRSGEPWRTLRKSKVFVQWWDWRGSLSQKHAWSRMENEISDRRRLRRLFYIIESFPSCCVKQTFWNHPSVRVDIHLENEWKDQFRRH